MATFEWMTVSSPMTTSSAMLVKGPTATFLPSFAEGAIDASGETPVIMAGGANQRSITAAQARYGLATRMYRASVPPRSFDTRIAPARVLARRGAYFGFERKLS